MKRLCIVAEGQTEQTFVNEILAPYLYTKGQFYTVQAPLIRISKSGHGGFVNFKHLKNTINALLKESKDADLIVTTFVDFFRMPKNMPQYDISMAKKTKRDQILSLEQALASHIPDRRFVPYIQLHEFEALLFVNNKGFESYWDEAMCKKTNHIIQTYTNPEDINTTPEGAPSKRLLAINEQYDKVIEGNVIALEVGIEAMLSHCPRFREWVNVLVKLSGV